MPAFTHKAMDTVWTVTFGTGENAQLCAGAAAAVFARIDALESILTRFSDTGDVAMIAALRPGEVATVCPETMTALEVSARVCAATGGAFDPTVGPVMARLKRCATAWAAVSPDELDDAFARGGMQRLVLDVEHRRVAVTPDRLDRATPLELDFGGIGKGLALDECARLLRGEQFELGSFLLDAGTSTILAHGAVWPLGVGGVWKRRTRLDTVVRLAEGALSGSCFEIQGAHVVDARRRRAAERWAQTWALCPTSAAVADALSTAALALEPAELDRACRELGARVLVARRQAEFTDRFRDPLKWFGPETVSGNGSEDRKGTIT